MRRGLTTIHDSSQSVGFTERSFRPAVVCGILACLSACSTLPDHDARARALFFQGAYAESAAALDSALTPDSEGSDRLLYLMDRGVMLHAAGRYPESNRYLLAAAMLADGLDVIRLTEEAAKIVTNETVGVYRGEDFERVLIHTYLAMNFAAMGELEEALVECRRIHTETEHIARERNGEARPNPFAVYLSALLYESMGELNDAYVDYKRARGLLADFAPLREDLPRVAARLGMADEAAAWEKEFGATWSPPAAPLGEVVVLFESGLAPRKVPDPRAPLLPRFATAPCLTACASVRAGDLPAVRTRVLDDVEGTLIRTLDDRTAGLTVKRLLAAGAKEFAAWQLASRSRRGGRDALFLLFSLLAIESEKPDLRSWQTLPKALQLARLAVPPGTYDVRVQPLGPGDAPSGPEASFSGVRVRAGRRVFLNCRTVR